MVGRIRREAQQRGHGRPEKYLIFLEDCMIQEMLPRAPIGVSLRTVSTAAGLRKGQGSRMTPSRWCRMSGTRAGSVVRQASVSSMVVVLRNPAQAASSRALVLA
jgi:hypothetical protein